MDGGGAEGVTFGEALRFWVKLGFISFGGPAGQIAIMHRELVERRRWIGEARFLHALNYCMLLPGPEAQQLATCIGWLLHRTAGGLVAGGCSSSSRRYSSCSDSRTSIPPMAASTRSCADACWRRRGGNAHGGRSARRVRRAPRRSRRHPVPCGSRVAPPVRWSSTSEGRGSRDKTARNAPRQAVTSWEWTGCF